MEACRSPLRSDGQAAQHAEDGADVDVDVDVGRAVERIEDDDVLAGLDRAVEGDRLLVLFADQRGDGVAQAQAVEQGLVGVDVELLLLLALHVGLADGAEHVAEAGGANLGLDHFGGQRNAAQQPAEPAAGLADLLLLLQDVLLHSCNHSTQTPLAFPIRIDMQRLNHFQNQQVPVHEARVAERGSRVWMVILIERTILGEVGRQYSQCLAGQVFRGRHGIRSL